MAKRQKFSLKIGDDGEISVTDSQHPEENKRKVSLGGTVVSQENCKLSFVPERNLFEDLDQCLTKFNEDITKMGLKSVNTDQVIALSTTLIQTHTATILKSLEHSNQINDEIIENIRATSNYATEQLKKMSTAYLRLNEFRKNNLFVEPKEISLLLKWRSKCHASTDLPSHRLVPSTFQFVPISKTLSAILSQPDFQEMYTKYNLHEKHQCSDDIYIDFCCGSTFKNKPIFADKNVVQIQIGMDDFEICSPLKSAATKHKICGIYMQIRNLPKQYVAKIDNIYLVALVSSEDLKSDKILNDVMEIIVEDLRVLENVGFWTDDGKHWKAVLINISSDNLGANTVLGFSKGFNANYYCRVCEMERSECQRTTFELKDKLRTKTSYQEHVLLADGKHSLTDTKGIRMKCVLNELDNFDIFENISLDIMHDIFEGIIFFFLHAFFEKCISKQIINETNIIVKLRDFNYGPLFESKIPSILNLGKPNLGQNASQAYCLMLHLPFIFYEFKNQLGSQLWTTLEAILQIVQIMMSNKITESNLILLEKRIETFLNGMLELDKNLIPKAHLITHYPGAIRRVGPLKHMWMCRFECKHKFFTDAARQTNNFININLTLAMKHQKEISQKKFSIQDEIVEAKRVVLFRDCAEFSKYEIFLMSMEVNFDQLMVLPFLHFNNYVYRAGLVLVENFIIYNILFVLKSQKNYFFLCETYELKGFESSLNSIEIQPYSPEPQLAYIAHSELFNFQSFSKKICKEKLYVIAENLNVFDPTK